MVVQNYTMAAGTHRAAPHRQRFEEDGGMFWDGVRVYPRVGENFGDAYRRQMKLAAPTAKPATKPAAKPAPAVDPRVTELKRMEARVAEMKRCVPMAEELRKLEAERVQLQQRLDAREKASNRKGFASKLRFAQPFRVGRKPA